MLTAARCLSYIVDAGQLDSLCSTGVNLVAIRKASNKYAVSYFTRYDLG